MTASTPRKPQPDLTADQLQAALRRLQRPHWGTCTLDDALAHPTHGPAIRGLARQLAREALRALPQPHFRAAPPATGAVPRLPKFDPRKAAANDRDD